MVDGPLRLLNVKVSDDLRALVVQATELSGLRSMSEWMREALEAGARQEIAGHERAGDQQKTRAQAGRPSGRSLGMQVGHVRCTHPSTAREQTVEAEVCSLCSAVVRWKI